MAQAASTALPPRSKIFAPAVAAIGFPVTAIQWRPESGGFCVRLCAIGPPKITLALTMAVTAVRTNPVMPSPALLEALFPGMHAPQGQGVAGDAAYGRLPAVARSAAVCTTTPWPSVPR